MDTFKNINEILDFAMVAEQEAFEFYSELAAKSTNDAIRNVFEQFATEEKGHKSKLAHIKQVGSFELKSGNVADLKIADYTVTVDAKPNMSYQEALIVAMKKEKAAFHLYLDLSNKAQDENIRSLFLLLSQEEAKHKLRFEIEYDEFVLREN